MPTPNLGLPLAPNGSNNITLAYNQLAQIVDAFLPLAVQSMALAAPPVTVEADIGKRWIIGASPTGAWAGAAGKVALCTGPNVWTILTPPQYIRAYVIPLNAEYRNNALVWTAV